MPEYVCACTDECKEEYYDGIMVEAGSIREAEVKALREWCPNLDYECVENSYCECKLNKGE